MKYIEPEFESYRKKVIPANASPVQVRECRLAFYAGAHGLFHLVLRSLSSDQEATDADMQFMADIERELSDFGVSVGQEGSTVN